MWSPFIFTYVLFFADALIYRMLTFLDAHAIIKTLSLIASSVALMPRKERIE